MKRKTTIRLLAILALVLVLLSATDAAFAQGCAMCYPSANAQNEAGKRALNQGILFLLSPTVLIFGGLLFVAYKRRE